jgi:hypothetical protein
MGRNERKLIISKRKKDNAKVSERTRERDCVCVCV